MSRISLAPVTAVTCNEQFEVIEDAAIYIDGARIVYVRPAAARTPGPPGNRIHSWRLWRPGG